MIIETATLETIYWLALGVGLGLLILSIVVGDMFDFIGDLDFDLGGSEISVVPVFFTFMAAFGAGGLIGIQAFGFGQGGSIVSGLGTGAAGGALAAALFSFLGRAEQKDAFELSKLVGQRGRCSLSIAPGKIGRVTVTFEGMTRAYTASASDEIASGEEVVVTDVIGSQLTVARPDGP